jgi:hypothetical protein
MRVPRGEEKIMIKLRGENGILENNCRYEGGKEKEQSF